MDQRTRKAAIDSAEHNILLGWCTGAAITALRSLVLVTMLVSDTPVPRALALQISAQAALSGVATYGLFRRQFWAAIGLALVWGVGYVYSWVALGRVIPPLGLIGVAAWYGIYRGIRGTRRLRSITTAAVPAV